MGSIIKKKIKNQIYYYYVESRRIDGKPKLVNQKYLGTADKLLEKVLLYEKSLQEQALYSNEAEFGAVALLYDIGKRLDIVKCIDEVIPKRKQGASIGEYILTAAINQAAAPSSKSGLKDWYSGTCLPEILGIKASAFTPQNFWNNTCIPEDTIDEIENCILRKVLGTYQIDTSHLIYDATNFFTYIDTMQPSDLAKRGHSKEKRNDLRIVGLSLMVSPEYSIPLLHDTYPENRADSTQFTTMIEELKNRYEVISSQKTDITVVFDRGNNSEDNIDLLESGGFPVHYVGGLKNNQVPELFAVSKEEYLPLKGENFGSQTAYRMQASVFNRMVTTVIVYNPDLERGQLQGIRINMDKTEAKLSMLKQKLDKRAAGILTRGKKPTIKSVTVKVQEILSTEFMSKIYSCEVTEQKGVPILSFSSSEEVLDQICHDRLGKTALFTDRSDFTNEEIINAYRSAWHVESAFKQMKNTEHLTVRPIFHWTDEKIRVHIFTCVLAYRLCCLLRKELCENGINCSINKMLDEAASIKKVTTFFGSLDKPEKVQTFTHGGELSNAIEELYHLTEKYS